MPCTAIVCAKCWPQWATRDAYCREHAQAGFRTWPRTRRLPGEADAAAITTVTRTAQHRTGGRQQQSGGKRTANVAAWMRNPFYVNTTQGTIALRPLAETARLMGCSPHALLGADNDNPIRRARRTIECHVPPDTARAFRRARDLLNYFVQEMRYGDSCEEAIDPDITADFLVWRVAPPSTTPGTTSRQDVGVPEKPPGTSDVVEAATASGDLSAVRALWSIIGREDLVRRTQGPQVDRTLARLSARVQREAVQKTPAEIKDVQRIMNAAMDRRATTNDPHIVRDAAMIGMGFYFMMRNGEIAALQKADVTIEREDAISVIFRGEKARGGQHRPIQAAPRVRWVRSHQLAELLRRYKKTSDATAGPFFRPRDAHRKRLSTNAIRSVLRQRLGNPPARTDGDGGTGKPLPWSLRAGGATYAMRQGAGVEEVRRMGRWTSETSLQYSVMNRETQLDLWRRIQRSGTT